MSDLIDKQAALDAIMGQPPEPHYPSWYAAQIEDLPAVQPDHTAESGEKVERTGKPSQDVSDSDLISRKAAIDAVEYITSSMSVCVNSDECHGMKRMQRQAVIELTNLPSAQPEKVCIARINLSEEQVREAVERAKNEIVQMLSSAQPEVLACGEGELSAEPEPHEGHWIGSDGSYICSECNCSPMDFIDTMGASFDAYVETPMNYCPNCGARMKGDTSEDD